MGTTIRTRISDKNPYHISKYRYLELKNFCLQYPEWKQLCRLGKSGSNTSIIFTTGSDAEWSDPTYTEAEYRSECARNIQLVELCANEADPVIGNYILKGVTENYGYPYLQTIMQIPCCRDVYYKLYRKFFWILDKRKRTNTGYRKR